MEVSASSEIPSPAQIGPPKNEPSLSTTLIVVAVPKSRITKGKGYLLIAATAPTAKSAPSCAGLSILILSPVLTPGPTNKGFAIPISSHAFLNALDNEGTTLETIHPSRSSGLIL